MTGCIAQRNGIYYVRLTYYDQNHKRKDKWVTTGLSGKGAKQKANAELLYDDLREFNFTMAYDNHVMCLGYPSLSERRAAYARVSGEDIKRAASEIFKTKNLTFTMKGNKKKIPTEKIKEILSRLG